MTKAFNKEIKTQNLRSYVYFNMSIDYTLEKECIM